MPSKFLNGIKENCTQCNQCAYICPHAAIRAFLLDDEEVKKAPAGFDTVKAVGKELAGLSYRIQVSPLDCTGCGNCIEICPSKQKALVMKPAAPVTEAQAPLWDFAMTVSDKDDRITNKYTVKNSQFLQPLLEFSGACAGCGETPYIKILTQLFGDRMMIANATAVPRSGAVVRLQFRIAPIRKVKDLPGPTPCSKTMPSTVMVCSSAFNSSVLRSAKI